MVERIEIIAQADRVHDAVHRALDLPTGGPFEHYMNIKQSVIEVERLLVMLERLVSRHEASRLHIKRPGRIDTGTIETE